MNFRKIKTKFGQLLNSESIFNSGKNKDMFLSAIIVAGGVGSRFGSEVPKQFAKINGIETVMHTLIAFEKCKYVKEIIIVGRQGNTDAEIYKELCEKHNITKYKTTVSGGKTRFDSAKNGYGEVSDNADFVAVHDAARCLITPEQIEKIADEALRCGAAAPCTELTDTVKIINDKGYAVSTPKRDSLRAIQTPQIIRSELYCVALKNAIKEELSVTDDASLVEELGFCVKLVDVGKENIKITYPEDIERAEKIFKDRQEKAE